ncbi:MAG: hypothetical protein PWP51_2616 [Clostridiales bacterium]|jgi:predicted transcriptional regulator|nr:hypothetical protein [Clostridiales bacterium]MDN5300063.1 hypothetical protein [Clostridiales bacterium]
MGLFIKRLPDAELEVMRAVWECTPPVTRGDLEYILTQTHPMATTTILTLLSRLVERKFLSIEKMGRSNAYTPIISKQDYLASQSKRFFEKLCGGDVHVFANALCDSGLSEDDIETLRDLLERGKL